MKTGIADLNNGMADLTSGSADYKNGIAELNNSSTELLNGSAAIDKALVTMKDSLNQDMSGADFGKLRVGLIKISEGMKEAATGLTTLRDNYTKAYQKLDESIHAIPAHEISEEEIKRIASKLEEEQDRKIVQKLAETYGAAQKAKGTYEATKEVFAAVDPTLNEISGAQTEMATSLETMASEVAKASEKINIQESIKELQNGLGKLSDNYKSFHGGLVEYTHGVRELSNAYQSIHQGVTDIYHGTTELENGTTELRNGTSKLADSTSELPEQMQEEIDKMINEFDKSDFDAESFVSEKNENIQSVQFVIKTEAIEKEEQAEEQQETAKEKSFWDKLLDLFR
ncbi:hypothetical protein JCM21714_3372 [Gracilibacillus boraciitolerans JCM 21714]|uniref:Phage infection protein n=1 Tax=Gracilibacillus boraciitolerans JCM 21714 TaxID=1298598 RepID=W4VM01_9BACI|nr:hypothetical protein [Gracilibacillus boraciitolerans]GAE94232.1 hypothetical protein JCM21714_3372 [Gracilibacillus boraciitolerans JCM 21714]